MNINPESAKDILCKNILIYGYCKFENKGCAFSHSKSQLNQQQQNQQQNQQQEQPPMEKPNEKRKFNFNTPSFQPQVSPSSVSTLANKFSNLSPKLKEIPVFVPQGQDKNEVSTPISTPTVKKFNVSTPSFTPSNSSSYMDGPQMKPSTPSLPSHMMPQPPQPSMNPYLSGNGGPPQSNDYMFQQSNSSNYPLNYHLYAPAPPPRLTMPLASHETNANEMFIPNDLREYLQKKNEATLQALPRSNLPDHVKIYHSLVPIDSSFEPVSKVWKVPTYIYKVFSNEDGNAYVLRKIDHSSVIRIVNELPFRTIKKWKFLKSANIVPLHDCFTSMAFGEGSASLMLVYDYFPNSNTLVEQHITRKLGGKLEPINEDILWTYITQLTNALTRIHEKGLAARSSLDLTKILVTNKNRIRLSSVGIDDILYFEDDDQAINTMGAEEHIKRLQMDDIRKFGKVILDLAVSTKSNVKNLSTSEMLQYVKSNSGFSQNLTKIIELLNTLDDATEFDLSKFNEKYLSRKLLSVINNLENLNDYMEAQLSSELENARLFRLMTKLNFIIDRPEFATSNEFAENGSKHIIKLFRDYVFFQYDEFGKPMADLSRVLVNLNKLDAGIDEKILLISRDEKSCIIVSYKEIRDTIDSVFRSISR